ncbi:MAG: FliO/MopB family protein [Gammaproteobacteria bacterium]
MNSFSRATTRGTVAVLTLALAPAAFAQASAGLGGQFLAVLLPLMVVLGALLAALVWLNKGRGLYRNTGPLKLLQVLAVSSRERVVVLDAGKRIMVVGVASGRVSLLSMIDPTDLDDPTS